MESRQYGIYTVYSNGKITKIKNKKGDIFEVNKIGKDRITLVTPYGTRKLEIRCFVYEAFNNEKIDVDSEMIYFIDETIGLIHTNLVKDLKAKSYRYGIHKTLDSTIEWRDIPGYDDLYKISENGDVYSFKKRDYLARQISNLKYHKVDLFTDNRDHSSPTIHKLMKLSFPEKIKREIEGYTVIDHIDRNPSNNHFSNLREATASENALNCNRDAPQVNRITQFLDDGNTVIWESVAAIIAKNPHMKYTSTITNACLDYLNPDARAYGFRWEYTDMVKDTTGYVPVIVDTQLHPKLQTTNEYGIPIEVCNLYKINKNGIIIDRHNLPLRPAIGDAREYVSIMSDYIEGEDTHERTTYVHRLVALAFVPNPNKYEMVRHINGNSNDASNLEWCTGKRFAVKTRGKKVYRLAKETPTEKFPMREFDCMVDAYKHHNKKRDGKTLKQACENGTLLWGFYWSFIHPDEINNNL